VRRFVRDTFQAARAEVAFAYENVRFFRQHLEAVGLRPADLEKPEDLRRIPPTRKMHYRRNFPAGVLAAGKTLNDRFVHRSQSSGTGGERLVTVAPTFVLAERMSTVLSVNPPLDAYLTGRPNRRTCRYAAPNCSDVECANPRSTTADRILADGTLVLPVHHDLLATTEPMIEQAIRELQEYEPHWLYADPTHLAFLLRGLRRRGVKPPPVGAIALTYSLCTGVARRQLGSSSRRRCRWPRSSPCPSSAGWPWNARTGGCT
jgi:phenylacetate-CoA ligase